MSSEHNVPIIELPDYVKKVEQRLVSAEQTLRSFAGVDEQNIETMKDTLMAGIEEYQAAEQDVDALHEVFQQWENTKPSAYEQSEISRSLGQIKRLKLVSKNIQRLAKKQLGIPDPESMQEQMQYMMASMSAHHK